MISSMNDTTTLNNGVAMPWLGLGVFQSSEGTEVEQAVAIALDVGYRSIDTAAVYGNERGVGAAMRTSGVSRDQIFLTTKLWNDDQRASRQMAAFEDSLDRLGTDYVDLYLVHWPVKNRIAETWQVMEQIQASGRARAIGVSNFMIHHLEELLAGGGAVPAVNQVEFHPRLIQADLVNFCRSRGIQYESWSPLMQGAMLNSPVVQSLAQQHGHTPAQIILRWNLEHKVVAIPKSVRRSRIEENAGIFDFALSADDVRALDALEDGTRTGPHPDEFGF